MTITYTSLVQAELALLDSTQRMLPKLLMPSTLSQRTLRFDLLLTCEKIHLRFMFLNEILCNKHFFIMRSTPSCHHHHFSYHLYLDYHCQIINEMHKSFIIRLLQKKKRNIKILETFVFWVTIGYINYSLMSTK